MWMNMLCTAIEVSGLFVVIFFGFKYIGQVNLLDVTSVQNPSGDITFSLVLSGAVLTFFSFVGFEDILNVSEEVIAPERTIPLGLLLAVGISSLIYMCISVIAVSVIPAAQLADSKQPLVDVVKVAAPWFPSSIYSVISMFAVTNTALLNFVMGSRLVYGMAKQKLLPDFLAKVHPKRHTPHVAAGVLFVILLVLAFSGDISSLAKATSVLLLICFVLVNLALVVLTRRGERGGFEVPIFVPVLGAVVCAALLFNAKAPELLTAGAILVFIGVLYFVVRPSEAALSNLDG
jgi:amino acid transporter